MKATLLAATVAFVAVVGAGVSSGAQAQAIENSQATDHPLGEHPAVLVKRQAPVVDTNRLILMHPAQLMVIEAPTPTLDHPAVAVRRPAHRRVMG